MQKFGGTCLGTPERLGKAAGLVLQHSRNNIQAIPVVSAVSPPNNKEEGTSSLLLQARDLALQGKDYNGCLGMLHDLHMPLTADQKGKKKVQEDLDRLLHKCSLGRSFSTDSVLACGERMAAEVLGSHLRVQGGEPRIVDLSSVFKFATSFDIRVLAHHVKKELEVAGYKGQIPVVTGFFGQVNMLSTFGRGYTDYTAAVVAALSAEYTDFEVWKESGGVFTANPTIVQGVRPIERIWTAEAAELTTFGNEVLHPAAVKVLDFHHIETEIKDFNFPLLKGTTITTDHDSLENPPPLVTALCGTKKVKVVNFHSRGDVTDSAFLGRIFGRLHDIGITPLSSSSNLNSISIAFSTDTEVAAEAMDELNEIGFMEEGDGNAVISLIGRGMSGEIGLACKVFKILTFKDINVKMFSQNYDEMVMTLVIDELDLHKGMQALHDHFFDNDDCGGTPHPEMIRFPWVESLFRRGGQIVQPTL